ncbi:DUF6247 family protein [Actinomadura sp. 3N407]|uniref:DUF6247 family protein n=1 Tax=Actinomadura sp. 3N407 TaxID=3457423 RepID=UPI003FCCCF6A
MTADAVPADSPVARTPASIRSALSGTDRADFEADYAAALTDARITFDLRTLDATIERWWRYANLTAGRPTAQRAITRIAEQVRNGVFEADVMQPVDFTALRG